MRVARFFRGPGKIPCGMLVRVVGQGGSKMNDWRMGGVVALLGLATGCVSVANSQGAVPLDDQGRAVPSATTPAGLRVSGEELTDLASPHFEVIEVTLENPTERWIRVRAVKLDFESPQKNAMVSYPAGSELASLLQATQQRNAIEGTNRRAALALVALGGAAVTVAGPTPSAEVAGAVVTAGALGALAATDANDQFQQVERVQQVPKMHLFAGPIDVPPGLFAKRWVVLEAKDKAGSPCLDSVRIDYAIESGAPESVRLKFRNVEPGRRPAFQPNACYVPRSASST